VWSILRETLPLPLSGMSAPIIKSRPPCLLTVHRRGIPAKLMDFLRNLDAYRKAIPTIHTLRLSNQFGKGEHAAITKLPKELIGFNEEELLAIHRRGEGRVSLGWTRKYHCYERSCRPREHRLVYNPIYEYFSDDGGSDYSIDDSDSERDEMYDGDYEACYENRDG
jgi:hypothetical protein